MVMSIFIFPGSAAEATSNDLPYWHIESDSEVYMGYMYTVCAESYSGVNCSAPYSQGYMIFEADDPSASSKSVRYTLGHRIDYILDNLRQYESITETVSLSPTMDDWWGCFDGDYVEFYYNLAEMELCQYIFASATTSDGQLRAAKAYKDVDFAVYGY